MHRNKITGNCLEKWHGRTRTGWRSWRVIPRRGMRTYRPETKIGGAASERLLWSVDHLSFHSCTWRGGAEGWGLSLRARKSIGVFPCPLVPSKGLGSGSHGWSLCSTYTLGPGSGSVHHRRGPFHHCNEDEMGITVLRCYKTKTKGPPWWSRG